MKRSGWLMLVCAWGAAMAMPTIGQARTRDVKRDAISAAGNDCARECSSQSRRVYNECRDNGGSRQECLERAHRYLRDCVADCDTPPTCDEICKLRAEHVLQSCLDNGGTEADCAEEARQFHERCVNEFCRPANPCEARCVHEARSLYRECVAAGHDESDCAERARAFARNCVDENCGDPVTCEDRCARVAHQVHDECIEAGGNADECAERARAALDRCLQTNCQDPPDCEDRCAQRARHLFNDCVESGEPEDACAERARAFFRRCVNKVCVEPPTCEEGCAHRAERLFRVCVDEGNDEVECRERAKRFLHHCLDHNCRTPADCREKCAHHAHRFLHECVESGRPFDVCAAEARDVYAKCVEENCLPAPTCKDRCEHLARHAFRACVADGGGEEDCRARAAEVLAECIEKNCEQRCGGILGAECPDDKVCIFPPGACDVQDAIGVCRELPQACPEVYEPVCACDGMTYDNACFATMAGASIDHRGPCHVDCDPTSATACPDGEFCKLPPGTCNHSDALGKCIPIPVACPDVWDPVCGCDGNTYGNRCEADAAGMSVAHEGECRQRCGGIAGIPCDDDEFCLFPVGSCEISDAQGTCVDIPQACPDVWAPVCGCDGETYANRCDAIMNGAQIAHEGPCRQVCGGIQGLPCDDNEFCRLPHGMCDAADIQGVCVELPEACPRVFLPVCGCDGETYPNQCDAARAGAQIDHEGPCRNPSACRSNDDCADAFYCQYVNGCGGDGNSLGAVPGLCLPRPLGCPDVWAPVCGCNGETYANACDAAAAGVSIRQLGECRD